MDKPLILVTNDDGIYAPQIAVLVDHLERLAKAGDCAVDVAGFLEGGCVYQQEVGICTGLAGWVAWSLLPWV